MHFEKKGYWISRGTLLWEMLKKKTKGGILIFWLKKYGDLLKGKKLSKVQIRSSHGRFFSSKVKWERLGRSSLWNLGICEFGLPWDPTKQTAQTMDTPIFTVLEAVSPRSNGQQIQFLVKSLLSLQMMPSCVCTQSWLCVLLSSSYANTSCQILEPTIITSSSLHPLPRGPSPNAETSEIQKLNLQMDTFPTIDKPSREVSAREINQGYLAKEITSLLCVWLELWAQCDRNPAIVPRHVWKRSFYKTSES